MNRKRRRQEGWPLASARPSRLPAFLFIFSLLSLLAIGCGEDKPSVVLWHAYGGDDETAIDKLAKQYEAATGVRVELLAIPYDAYAAKLEAAVPHAHGPDLFIDAHERLGSYIKNGLVAPVGDALPSEDVVKFDDVAMRALTIGDTRYAVPLSSKCLALYMNESLLPRPPASIDDLRALRSSLPEDSYPLAYEAETPYFHVPFLHAFGGEMLDAKDHFAMIGPGAEASLAYVRDLHQARIIPDEPSDDLVQRLFVSGHAAAVISGPWFAASLQGKAKYKVAPLPPVAMGSLTEGLGDAQMRPYLTVEGVFVTPTGAAHAEARAFARWLGSDDAAVVRATIGHQVVATRGAWSDPHVASDQALAAFRQASESAVLPPASTAMRATWVPAGEAIKKVWRGDLGPAAALDEARARFDDAMKPPGPSPSPAPLFGLVGLALLAGAFAAVKRARMPGFRAELRASKPAYAYVAHAALAILVLVLVPLIAGALTSFFVGTRESPQYVGFGNYISILTARGGRLLAHGSFYLTLLVTVLWTVVNVALHVGIGLTLGIALSRPLLRLKAVYRVLLILPWAVPSYVTARAWKGMFHRQFGAVNAILDALGVERVSWFSNFSTALTANVATNVWLGFPFMMVVTLGALTSIPKDVLEAAEVDGATRWQRFRLVTLPLLRPALLPSVVLGAVWTFNMFNVVFLVSGGEPDQTTDILVSEAYRWAFTRDAQYGYAAAYAVLIFLLLVFGSRVLGKVASRKGEEGIA